MEDRITELRKNTEKAQNYFSKKLAFTIGPIELKYLMDEGKVKIIDARRREDYDIGHIPTAISIPKDEIDKNFDNISKDDINVVYGYNQQCHAAYKAALTLAEYGYSAVVLEGGFKVWMEDFRFASVSEK